MSAKALKHCKNQYSDCPDIVIIKNTEIDGSPETICIPLTSEETYSILPWRESSLFFFFLPSLLFLF